MTEAEATRMAKAAARKYLPEVAEFAKITSHKGSEWVAVFQWEAHRGRITLDDATGKVTEVFRYLKGDEASGGVVFPKPRKGK